jgi:hypothetical protein
MNERINELVRESNLDVYGLGKERYRWEYTVEKFAELLVRECALTAGLMEHEGRKNIGAQILDNFGVEE